MLTFSLTTIELYADVKPCPSLDVMCKTTCTRAGLALVLVCTEN